MNAHERARHTCEQAERMGLDAPTEGMISDAIGDAESNVVNEIVFVLVRGGFERAAEAVRTYRRGDHE